MNPLSLLLNNHPKGLQVLFFTELWERFSYYGMRAILILYMIASPQEGGLNFASPFASIIYGTYTSLVYMTAIPGGFIADNYLGPKLAIIIGGSIIALGHLLLTINTEPFFYSGLIAIVIGTGLLKPSVSSIVGNLYIDNESKRDSGFIIFYMGINLGAALAPLVCGFLAQGNEFKSFLTNCHLDPKMSWHFGFGAAAIGMILGLITFIRQKYLIPDNPVKPSHINLNLPVFTPLTKTETNKLLIIALLFLFSAMFWAVYEQGGASLNIFANKYTNCQIGNYNFPPSYLQTFQAVFIIIFAPLISKLWLHLGNKQPRSQAKFVLGLILLGIGICLMVPASYLALTHKISPLWIIGCYLFEVLGELCLSPVGLSTVTKLAPARYVGLVLGIWYLSYALGNFLAGLWCSLCNINNPLVYANVFLSMAVSAILASIILYLLLPLINKLEK